MLSFLVAAGFSWFRRLNLRRLDTRLTQAPRLRIFPTTGAAHEPIVARHLRHRFSAVCTTNTRSLCDGHDTVDSEGSQRGSKPSFNFVRGRRETSLPPSDAPRRRTFPQNLHRAHRQHRHLGALQQIHQHRRPVCAPPSPFAGGYEMTSIGKDEGADIVGHA